MKTKWLLLSLFALFFGQTNFAQAPEKVHSIVKVFKTYEWYVEQNSLWEKETKKNKRNPDAWENLYASARMAKIMSPTDEERNQWLEKMGKTKVNWQVSEIHSEPKSQRQSQSQSKSQSKSKNQSQGELF